MAGPGFPIRVSRALRARPLARAFRRLAAPFIGSWYQGIPREPFAPSPLQDLMLFLAILLLTYSADKKTAW